MKLKVIRRYHDLELGRVLEEGDEIQADKKRADKLIRLKFAAPVEEDVKSEPLE